MRILSVAGMVLAGLAAAACMLLLVRVYIRRLVDRRIASYQHDLMAKHIAEVNNMYRQMRGWRHDYHNHIQTMKAYLALDQVEEMQRYLGMLDADLADVDTLLKSGNVMADAILNSKLSLARVRKIAINAKAAVPEKLSIPEIDLCVIIGNLLDNAMEACMKQEREEDRFIRVYIAVLKGQLYISVTNSTEGAVLKQGKEYRTTKPGSAYGFGLMRMDRIVAKYDGYLNRQHEEGAFATEVLLPLG
ncbi:MAG: ATP-binding protein [Paenibacillaceae bacterium]|jgi:sensor histidine kinase regulating citrate/malate metabolism|nr:ATP-binding protein [Paenibacillaceae bacterium]